MNTMANKLSFGCWEVLNCNVLVPLHTIILPVGNLFFLYICIHIKSVKHNRGCSSIHKCPRMLSDEALSAPGFSTTSGYVGFMSEEDIPGSSVFCSAYEYP